MKRKKRGEGNSFQDGEGAFAWGSGMATTMADEKRIHYTHQAGNDQLGEMGRSETKVYRWSVKFT